MSEEQIPVLIVAGEASGDLHAASLVRELSAAGDFAFFGSAGEKMRAEGVEPTVRADGLAIVGLLEIGRALPMFWGVYKKLIAEAERRDAKLAILVDFPDFNMKLAKALKKRGVTVVYYISPQLWAWRKYRINTIKKYVDLVISILPFEKDWYATNGVEHVEYVGNPLAMEVHADSSKEVFCERHGLDPSRPIVSLLPGSRGAEISRILPVLVETAGVMLEERPEMQFVVALPTGKLSGKLGDGARGTRALQSLGRGTAPDAVTWVEGETFDALNASDAAAITSGTATLEAGILGTPMAIVYKTSAINYKLLRPLIDVEHFGLINLIAGKRVAAELIQDDFTPQTLSDELFRLLEPAVNTFVREDLTAAVDKLGHGGASKRAADAILELVC
ncbi:MAG TPA: lipid-A-disaccharide synthase [Pyrinomonadaceae bacterium]|nr:lipid-A-disaccharide synthase [Pyrinomonadaceae bacterium]